MPQITINKRAAKRIIATIDRLTSQTVINKHQQTIDRLRQLAHILEDNPGVVTPTIEVTFKIAFDLSVDEMPRSLITSLTEVPHDRD